MEQLLDSSRPLDVGLLERTVNVLNTSADAALRSQADKVLVALKESPNAWESAGAVLEQSQDMPTKFFALQVLEDTIKFRWKALPGEQRQGIRNYVVKKIIDVSGSEELVAQRPVRMFLGKLNLLLVHILKHEWPQNWPNFIPEIVDSSSKSELLCENNMLVLKLLSEEVFDFSKEEMTTDKVMAMKQQLNAEFKRIFDLCQLVLNQSTRPGLVTVTLQTLLRFLAWIPFGYVFETPLVEQLATKFLVNPAFRNDALACLTEIAYLEQPQYDGVFRSIFMGVMSLLEIQLPPETDIPREYDRAGERERAFIRGLSLFLSTFFTKHLGLLEHPDNRAALVKSMFYLVSISMVDDDDVFKICLEFWNQFSRSLHNSTRGAMLGNNAEAMARLNVYGNVLSRVRSVMISKMAKPEEVLVVEDDDGAIVRETTKDTDAIAQYKTMRDTLVYLTHLDPEDTENIMLTKLACQCDESTGEFSWNNLNTLCWAIGSISGAMGEENEKRFLVTVIKDLLSLVEMKRGKNNKAVVASNIMYVVGQYPRFLHAHWKFLKTVVNKLFEFMHELHPGVQDMACDTFLKISQKCRSKFVVQQPNESAPFIDELLDTMVAIIRDLSPHQRHTFYEAVGYMVREQANDVVRNNLLERLMRPSAINWKKLMEIGAANTAALTELNALQEMADILRINVRVCKATGYAFRPQLMSIYLDMLNVYTFHSGNITRSVAEQGEVAVQFKLVKVMRVVKVEILKLIETFVSAADDPRDIAENFCPPLLEPVLGDYGQSPPAVRNHEALQLFTAIVNKLGDQASMALGGTLVEKILAPVFNPTLAMITTNFTDFPEHRIKFYKLLKALNRFCFERLFSVPEETQTNVINAIVWAFKHTERTVSETGLEITEKLLANVASAPDSFSQPFYQKYYVSLLQDVLYVLTDRLHKSSFTMHATILQSLFRAVFQNKVKVPLRDGVTDNQVFLQCHVSTMIVEAFPNVGPKVAQDFVVGMFDPQKDFTLFKTHVRDFLVRLREFSADDDVNELYALEAEEERRRKQQQDLQQRATIPGLLTQAERDAMADL